MTTHKTQILNRAAKARLPVISQYAELTEAGGLNELPVEQPTKIDLVINLKTAKTLGLTIPPSVLLHVDRTIE